MAHRTRRITRLIEDAGGAVEQDGPHLKVIGPGGTVRVATDNGNRHAWTKIRALLLRHAGLKVEGSP